MRTFSLLFCVVVGFTGLQAQAPYSYYLDSTSIWYEEMYGVDGFNSYYSRLTIYNDGDTVIAGNAFFKQYYTRWDSTVHVMFPSPPTVTTSGPQYYRSMREDNLARFWEWRSWLGTDVVINDFNLAVGDTLPDAANCLIDSMSVINFNGSPLKHFFPVWLAVGSGVIEAVGTTGPLCGLGIESNMWVTCYGKQGLTLQIDTSADCSVWPAPVYQFQASLGSNEQVRPSLIHVYPVPSTDRIIVEWGSGTMDEIRLVDPHGAIVARSWCVGKNRIEISLEQLAPGVYAMEFRDGDRSVGHRVVIKQ